METVDNNDKFNKFDKFDKFNKLYDNLSYFDVYGTSVLIFFIMTIFVFMVHSYCIVMKNTADIKENWASQRCNPRVMPFAGFINKPEGTTVAQFTADNFNFCVQNILLNITGFSFQPFTYLTKVLTSVLDTIKNAIVIIRKFMASLRNSISNVAKNVLDRILNIMVPLQQIFITFKTIVSKTEGILTAALYTSLSTYYALKSFLGAILQLIIQILMILVVVIAGLWILPFTWPAALSMTSVFLAISVPLAIIVVFMTQILHIQAGGIPNLSIPRVSSCFDKNTILKMNDGSKKPIQDIQVGDILEKNVIVTATLRLNATNIQMYKINGTIVSGTHIIKYQNKWIPVKMHPEKVCIENYEEPYIYCLNTTSKEIVINNNIFADWDELYDTSLEQILNTPISDSDDKIRLKENIHTYLDDGFETDTIILKNNVLTPIKNINIGDTIGDKENNDVVYAVVRILKKKNENENTNTNTNINTNTEKFNKFSKNSNNLELLSNYKDKEQEQEKDNYLIHLLTYSHKFTINGKVFDDYNSLIDLKLHK